MKNSQYYNAEQDINLLRNIEKTVEGNLNNVIASAQALLNNAKILSGCLHDNVSNQIDKASIASRYSQGNFVGQSATLPGVRDSDSFVDIESFKVDSARMEQIKGLEDKLESQTTTYKSICAEDIKALIKSWKQMEANLLVMQDSLETVNKGINPNY